MTFFRHYFIEGTYLGKAPATPRTIHGTITSPLGYSFFCPKCGELWASCPVEGKDFMVWSKLCRKHPATILEVPGSLTMEWEGEFVRDFPLPVVQHELLSHLQYVASTFPPGVARAAMELHNIIIREAKTGSPKN